VYTYSLVGLVQLLELGIKTGRVNAQLLGAPYSTRRWIGNAGSIHGSTEYWHSGLKYTPRRAPASRYIVAFRFNWKRQLAPLLAQTPTQHSQHRCHVETCEMAANSRQNCSTSLPSNNFPISLASLTCKGCGFRPISEPDWKADTSVYDGNQQKRSCKTLSCKTLSFGLRGALYFT